MRVKIFSESKFYELEERINKFIKLHPQYEIVDIKYCVAGYHIMSHYCMIMYRE